jgi:glycosyltransferase involved in cell wall biosynthesis
LNRIALDATYSLGDALSGVGVYSREILRGAAELEPDWRWDWFYRSQRYWRARAESRPPGVNVKFLADSLGNRSASVFHGLNQRLPRRGFRRQIATFHDLFVLSGEYSTPEFRARFAAQARDAAERADLIVAVSAFTGSQVQESFGVSPDRIRIIHHGTLPRTIPHAPREKLVLCVGAIQRRKGQAALVRAFRAMPDEWTLVLAGSNGFEAGETLAEVAKSPARERIRITGYVSEDQLAEFYGKASIFAFPSLDEGFGMPVLEAMAAGIPVVTSNRSALPEVAGDAAVLVDPLRDDQLATALTELSKDEHRRAELIQRGKARAEGFKWSHAVEQTVAVYRELL